MTLSRLAAGLAVISALMTPLAADTVYTYTGKDFNNVAPPYTDLDSITGEFTLSAPLADNMTFSFDNLSPLSFSFSDGVQTLTSSDGLDVVDFGVATNSSGTITEWYVALGRSSCGGCGIVSYFDPPGAPGEDDGDLSGNDRSGAILGDPGTWSMGSSSPSSVPEPGNLMLVSFGLVAMAVVQQRLRRRRRATVTLRRFLTRYGLGIGMLTTVASILSANSVTTYTYTGKDFTTAGAPFTTDDSITGSFTTATLGPDFMGDIVPTSYDFSDGVDTFTSTNSGIYGGLYVQTNSLGAIISWAIYINGPDLESMYTQYYPGVNDDPNGDEGSAPGKDYACVSTCEGYNYEHPGTWSASSVTTATPEPSSLWLSGIALLGMAGIVRRRHAKLASPAPPDLV